jgi:Fic family protein
LLLILNCNFFVCLDLSPRPHAIHPKRYIDILFQINSYICPVTQEIPVLSEQLFFNINQIKKPIIKAIYFHQELIRIHSFLDEKRRSTRIANKQILMYHLYLPIFIRDVQEKKEYNKAFSKIFNSLEAKTKK